MWKTQGYDLHLVTNSAGKRDFDLKQIFDVPAGTTFEPVFPFVLSDPDPSKVSHGISVDPPTGLLSFLPKPLVRNFIVTAVRTVGANIVREPLHIHIHDGLKSFELSPAPLTVRDGAQARLSLLAVFLDGTVGDLSRHPGLDWQTTVPTDAIEIAHDTGVITAKSFQQEVDVEVTLPPTLFPEGAVPPVADRKTGRTIKTDFPWSTAREAEFVRGAGAHRWREVPNLLFVPDGFVGADGRAEFDRVIHFIANKLQTSPYLRPLSYLLDEKTKGMNVFKVWIASPQEGAAYLSELRPSRFDGEVALNVPDPNPPAPGQNPPVQSLENLIHQVGLPTKVDSKRDNFDDQRAEWTRIYSAQHIVGVTDVFWGQWRNQYPRVFTRDVDTALGISLGDRPSVGATSRSFTWNPFRAQRSDVDQMLAQLFARTAVNAQEPVGSTWVSTTDPADPLKGKDRNFVYVISRGPFDAGTRTSSPPLVASTLIQGEARFGDAPTEAVITQLVPATIPSILPTNAWAVVAHEFGHTLSLGDEYEEVGKDLPAVFVPGIKQSFWNLVVDEQVMTNGHFDASKINVRWLRWPRIRAAALLQDIPTVATGADGVTRVTIRLRPGGGNYFSAMKAGDVLLLRRRPLVAVATTADADPSPFLLLDSRTGDQVQTNAGIFGDEIKALIAALTPSDITGLGKGVILFAPVQEGIVARTLPGLVHANLVDHIVHSDRPLNRPANVACAVNQPPIQTVKNFPAQLKPARSMSRILGLYDGGSRYSCKIYHPQGICIMRSQRPQNVFIRGGELVAVDLREFVAPFCHACRYILVDQLNPTAHGAMDDEYAIYYPTFP